MRIALAVVSVGAVTFLLRFLGALVKEVKSEPASAVIYFAKVKPSRQRVGSPGTELEFAL